jgi:hypothetical protein
MLLNVLQAVLDTDTVLDTLEHALLDLDLVGDAEVVTQALADLVFSGDALADLAVVLLRDVLGLTEGVVVCD